MPDELSPGVPANLRAFVCVHVLDGTRPVLYVTRPEGDWCVLCGDDDPADASLFRAVGIGHPVAADPTLREVLDLEPDEEADRDAVGGPWRRQRVVE